MTVGAYPGSFNPPTIAHLAVAEAAWRRCALERVDLVVSRVPLGKEEVEVPTFDDRVAVLEEMARARPWLGVRVTDARLLVDVAQGYDVLIVGADKWSQILDPSWYGSLAARDEALRRLPRVVAAPRPPHPVPPVEVLEVPDDHLTVSATEARAGRRDWMAPEAAEFDARTGAWSDPDRYRALRASSRPQ
jgi:hypothetical protein